MSILDATMRHAKTTSSPTYAASSLLGRGTFHLHLALTLLRISSNSIEKTRLLAKKKTRKCHQLTSTISLETRDRYSQQYLFADICHNQVEHRDSLHSCDYIYHLIPPHHSLVGCHLTLDKWQDQQQKRLRNRRRSQVSHVRSDHTSITDL